MKASEHYEKAIELLKRAEALSGSDRQEHRAREMALIATAQVHMTASLGEDHEEDPVCLCDILTNYKNPDCPAHQ